MSEDDRVPILDVRNARAFRRGHLPGAVHLHESRLLTEPFLLPPRHRRFLVVGRDAAHATAVAARLRHAGWIGAEPVLNPAVGADPARNASAGASSSISAPEMETGPGRGYLWEPAKFLEEVATELPTRGRAIDLACGSGRNAVFLALSKSTAPMIDDDTAPMIAPVIGEHSGSRIGRSSARKVLGVDILPDALAQARRLHRASGCPPGMVRFQRADLSRESTVRSLLRPERYAIVICFRYLDRDLLPLIATALAPGGMLVYETFLVRQREVHGKPSNPAYLLEPGELRQAFVELEILRDREGEDAAGNFTASLLARRGP